MGDYAQVLLAGPLPWTRMRHAHALLRLARRYGSERVELACRVALKEDLLDVVRLERIVARGGPPADQEHLGTLILLGLCAFFSPATNYASRREPTRPPGYMPRQQAAT